MRDSGVLSVSILGAKQAEVVVRAYSVMGPELAETNSGYIEDMLVASGALDVEVQVVELFEAGAR